LCVRSWAMVEVAPTRSARKAAAMRVVMGGRSVASKGESES